MKTYGLTGGLGMGKSAAGKLLRDRGVPVVDTDDLARQLVEPGQPALEEIQHAFGTGMLDAAGRLRRDEMARLVFRNPAPRKILENILHPRVRAAWLRQIEQWRAGGLAQSVVVIPLLFETDAAHFFDAVICVACSARTQRERLLARGWDATQIEQRLAAQWPAGKKMELSNYVVWTEGGLEEHRAQLQRIVP